MSKTRKKADLPSKTCPACGRPFAWRKKWERNWDDVVFCSQRCRREGSKIKVDETATQTRQNLK